MEQAYKHMMSKRNAGEEGVLISPQEIIASQALDQIGQILEEKGLTLEELIQSGREIHGELIEEEYGLESQE